MTEELMLKLRNLKVIFPNAMGVVKAVEGIDLDIHKGECVALVGESGCGKSVTSLSIMKLLNSPPALISVDELKVDGEELKDYSNKKMQDVRGKKISMIFQDAMSALNPVMTVGRQIQEVFLTQKGITKQEAKARAIKALELVGIPEPARRYNDFPHQLSGGMRQRVLIAMAFACNPELIIADEPTTALDVTVQAQVLDLIRELKDEFQMSVILISHNLGVVASMCDRIMVMYGGVVVEEGTSVEIFKDPRHPYTQGLLASIPSIAEDKEELYSIPGTVPTFTAPVTRCRFADRCQYATDACRSAEPALTDLGGGRKVRCIRAAGKEE